MRRLAVPLVMAALFQVALVVQAPLAAAQTMTCVFSAAQATATITLPSGGNVGTVTAVGGAIELNGAACGAATVTNTDTVIVNGAAGYQGLVINESTGTFAPGKTNETGSSDEIEFKVTLGGDDDALFVTGTSGPDHIVFGSKGVNLNADETTGIDKDVVADVIADAEGCQVNGNAGDDHLSAAGGLRTGVGTACSIVVFGGDDNDTLTGGVGSSDLIGDLGNDTMRAKGSGSTAFRGGPGNDSQVGDLGNDGFVADEGDGADVVDGGSGGLDTMTYYLRASTRVRVTLDGVANDGDPGANGGAGEGDNIENIDVLIGTSFDDTLIGSPSGETLNGIGGKDKLMGKGGPDALIGGTANDQLTGGGGADQLYGEAGADQFFAADGEVDSVDGGVDADTDVCTCDPNDIVTNIP